MAINAFDIVVSKEVKQSMIKTVSERFDFHLQIGALNTDTRYTASIKNTRYAGGLAKVIKTRKSKISNSGVLKSLLKKRINILATPFNKGNFYVPTYKFAKAIMGVAENASNEKFRKDLGKIFANIPKDYLAKGKFGMYTTNGRRGFRRGLYTGQLHKSIGYRVIKNGI